MSNKCPVFLNIFLIKNRVQILFPQGNFKCLSQYTLMNEINWSEMVRYNIILVRNIVKIIMKILDNI